MSNTSSIASIAAAWAGTAGGGLAMVKKYVAKAEKYIANAEKQAEEIITALEVLDTKLVTLTNTFAPAPAPKKAPARKTSSKAPEPKKRLR